VFGINPSNEKITTKPVATIKKLFEWFDHIGVQYFSFTNCISSPGKYTKQDVEYDRLLTYVYDSYKIIALGKFPSEVLDQMGLKHFMLPHPSGLNRKLNDKNYLMQQLEDCKNFIWSV
jgi:hypothetical protein